MLRITEHDINDFLSGYLKKVDLSLERMRCLLAALGNPHLRLPPVIHIAGTNGKGSASAFLRTILESAGYRVHVYTSPHLVHWRERYRIGLKGGSCFINDREFSAALRRVSVAKSESVTLFELLTAVMFLLFSEYPADVAVIEVGLGGRFDATNVLMPAVSLIMPVSLDHEFFLGEHIGDIAFEKAGIIKRESPLVIGFQDNEIARDTLIRRASQVGGGPLSIYGRDYIAYEKAGKMRFENQDGLIDLPVPRLIGDFQISNAAAAIETISLGGFKVKERALARGLSRVCWPARMQQLLQGKFIDWLPPGVELWLDGGHNPAAGVAVAQFFKERCENKGSPLILICGMINTKDVTNYLRAYKDVALCLCAVPVHLSDSGIPSRTLAELSKSMGIEADSFESVDDALKKILERMRLFASFLILICGSLYLAGEVLRDNGTPPI
ncbi:MAG: dihydrofolate synthase / folylpolyglutamate synthase [Candidatus Tokpelaia sp. JSC161]|jgi:dihydrofolate synthase/folylpolyglutamate synthase|nr:MAG: dihydrofolate synthase / folylpolyglutamate synthase [Candidatus Tokpelaia sp. JSC161]